MVLWGRREVSDSSSRSPTATKRSNYTGRSRDNRPSSRSRIAKPAAYHPTSQFLPDNANNIGHPLCGNRQSRILIKVNYFFHYLADPLRIGREEEGLIARIGTNETNRRSSFKIQKVVRGSTSITIGRKGSVGE